MSSPMEVYVFPLSNITLFPSTTKPLNIFEPRYLEMIEFSIQTKTPIALAFAENLTPDVDGEIVQHRLGSFDYGPLKSVRYIAGYGHPEIIERRENGTLLIFLKGLGKVKLEHVKETSTPFVVCEARPVVENILVKEELKKNLVILKNMIVRWIEQHIPSVFERDIFIKSLAGPEEVVGAFSAYLVPDHDVQQYVLELNDINERIEFLYRLAQSHNTGP